MSYESDDLYCPVCKDVTQHIIHNLHERDSSNDYNVCVKCNYLELGWGHHTKEDYEDNNTDSTGKEK